MMRTNIGKNKKLTYLSIKVQGKQKDGYKQTDRHRKTKIQTYTNRLIDKQTFSLVPPKKIMHSHAHTTSVNVNKNKKKTTHSCTAKSKNI